MIRRQEAKMIAEELYMLIRPDLRKATKDMLEKDTEEFLNIKDAAALIGCSPSTLYKTKDRIGAYTKVGNQLRFPKSALMQLIREGKLKSPNVL